MSILLSKSFLGTKDHLVLDDGKACWCESFVETDFVLGERGSASSIEPILELYKIEIPELVPEEHRKSINTCGIKNNVPWRYVLPKGIFRKNLKAFVTKMSEIEKKLSSEKYPGFFVETNEIFKDLKMSRIDYGLANLLNNTNESSVLKNIMQLQSGSFLPPPTYSRVSSKTGRLTVKGGPQILTLRKDLRQIFESTFDGGALFEIDFISLEPRVALNLTDHKSSLDDVYQEFLEVSGVNVTRDTTKLAVLCALYGAGTRKLENVLKSDGSEMPASQLMQKVRSFFGLSRLSSVLRDQAKSGFITNYFGRPIDVGEARDSILINNFLQSTATDVALHGFCDLVRSFPKCRAIFIIHDALIIDIPASEISIVQEYAESGFVHPELGSFPLKFKRLK